MEPTSLRFAAASRVLGEAARRLRLVVPSFRSPPGRHDAVRTIRRSRNGAPTISVAIRGRPWSVVLADMIEGVVVANDVGRSTADSWREAAWAALEDSPTAAAA